MRGRPDVANDESLDNGTSGTLRSPRTKATLDRQRAESSTLALTAGFGVAQPFPRTRTYVRRSRARHSRRRPFSSPANVREQADAAFDLERRAAVKPRMVAAMPRALTWICSRLSQPLESHSWSPQFDRD